jgi:hypothetical protein
MDAPSPAGQFPDRNDAERICTGARLALRRFVDELTGSAVNGTLTVQDVCVVAAAFEAANGELERIAQNLIAMSASHSQMNVSGERRRNFIGRVLVERFVDLLVSEQEALTTPGRFSRHVVPVFLYAVEELLGENRHRDHRTRLTAAAKRLHYAVDIDVAGGHQAGNGKLPLNGKPPLNWDALMADQEVKHITDDILVDLAESFEDFPARKAWFIRTIENALEALVPIKPGTGLEPFDDAEFRALFARLYRDMAGRLSDPARRSALLSRYGSTQTAAVEALLKHAAV